MMPQIPTTGIILGKRSGYYLSPRPLWLSTLLSSSPINLEVWGTAELPKWARTVQPAAPVKIKFSTSYLYVWHLVRIF